MMRIAGFRRLLACAGFAIASSLALTAHAAPQALGLVATDVPVPLVCHGNACVAHASAFCLQEARAIPPRETPYRIAAPDSVRLLLTTQDGQTLRLPAAASASFTVYRGFTAIRVSVPSAVLAVHGAVAAALEIDRGALLVAESEPGDPHPQTVADLDLLRTRLRPTATAFFDAPSVEADAAKLVNHLINALPETGRAPALEDGALWSDAISARTVARAVPAGTRLAADIHESCRTSRALGPQSSMRRCLESAHAGLMSTINKRLWDALGDGS